MKISIQAMKMPENQRDEKLFCGKDSPCFRNSCGDVVCFHQRREAVGGRFLVLEEKASKCELNKKEKHMCK